MNIDKKKIIRITTVPGSLTTLLKGQLSYVSKHFEVVGITSKSGSLKQLEEFTKNEGVKAITVNMTRKITPIKDLIALFKLYKILKKEKPFIVHSHTPKAGTLGMIAAKMARVPNRLHTVAGLPLVESTGIKKKVLITVERITYRCATKVYPNSFGLKDIILDEKITKKEKIKIIANGSSNGIDTNHFDPNLYNNKQKHTLKNELKIKENDFVFVFVGRLVKDKGINELIEAFDKLSTEFKNIKLLLIGGVEKDLDPLLPETTNTIDINPNIIATGWAADVRPYFAISNVLAFPSYREGFPNVVMQASSMELASIVTDINGCNEIIKHEEHGFIIPKKDIDSLYQAMVYALSNKEILKKMGVESRQNVINNYEQKNVWQAILEEYKSL
ncbi:glycosyltransferase family 4 protein [Flaviramulus aquimarinus]|uniref:Glycosyltransferase family 4 protein n=1 Tax=Flaviramulus aquimarinus TaxID=1170456 RepID=A0ABP9FCD9_9FLAO